MKNHSIRYFFMITIPAVLFVLCGCSVPLTPDFTYISSPYVTPSPRPTDSNSPSAFPTITPEPENTPEAEEIYPIDPVLVHMGPVCNAYTACDAEYIYYSNGSGIIQADSKGHEKQLTAITDFYRFIFIDTTYIYYTVYDHEYTMTSNENGWQWCNSYNLVVYNKKTKHVHTIRKHLTDVLEFNGQIYMIDHKDHSKLISYDITNKQFYVVTGLSKSIKDDNNANLALRDNELHFWYSKLDYLICDHKAILDSLPPYLDDSNRPLQVSDIVYYNQNVCLWTGTEFKILGIDRISYLFDTGSYRYIIDVNWGAFINGSECIQLTLFGLSDDGTLTKLGESISEDGLESVEYEYVNGWIFVFWKSDGTSAQDIFFKQYIS